MNINVLKNNELLAKFDLSKDIQGISGQAVTFFIGRAQHCHVLLDDMQISREHAQLIFKNAEWFIKKNSPFNELRLNGSDVNEAKLKNGDLVTIGQYILSFTIPEYSKNDEADSISDVVERAHKFEDSTIEKPQETSSSPAENDAGPPKDSTQTATTTEAANELEVSHDAGSPHVEEGLGDVNLAQAFDENPATETPLGDLPVMDAVPDGQEFPVQEVEEVDGTRVMQSFAKVELELFGEFAPYDRYVVDSAETFIGRDSNKCQIVLNDPEVSSTHAVIRKSKIGLVLEDLQSGNGTILNGGRINKVDLSNNDEFIIGSTTFTVKISSDFMSKEEKRLMPVEENQVIEVEEIVEEVVDQSVDSLLADKNGPVEKSFIKRILKDPQKRKKAIIGLVILMGAVMMMDDGSEQQDAAKNKAKAAKGSGLGSGDKMNAIPKKKRAPEEEQFLSATYALGQELFNTGKYADAIIELEKVKRVDPDYQSTKELIELASEGLRKIEELERKRQAELERAERVRKVKELVEKAKEATKERNITVAEALFGKISEMEPENFDVPQLKMELDAWKKEQERIKVEQAQKEAERNRKVTALAPSKGYYLKKDWFRAILKLEEFLKLKDMDEDLVQEATKMMEESKESLKLLVDPLLGKARSLKEGQDLKGAYENYNQILQFDPANEEAMNEMNMIREMLNNRSKKIYREAIISESLSLFDDAKEKLQEVQQVSPSDSDYYKKATEKLKDYLD